VNDMQFETIKKALDADLDTLTLKHGQRAYVGMSFDLASQFSRRDLLIRIEGDDVWPFPEFSYKDFVVSVSSRLDGGVYQVALTPAPISAQ